MQLSRRFTPLSMFILSVNGIIGSAWLFAPLYAAKIAGPAVFISWIIGGAAAALIALTLAEISTLIPVAGGTAHISQLTHGALVSMIFSWISWLSLVMLAPVEVQAVLQYASVFFPSLTHTVNGAVVLTQWGFLWAGILMFLLCFINVASFKGLVGFNTLLFVFKIAIILLTIFVLCHTQFYVNNFSPLFEPNSYNWHGILGAVATGGIAFAFNGFKNGVELAGESKNSAFGVPFAVVGSVIFCLLIYLGLQMSFIGAIDPAIAAKGWDTVSFTGDAGPFVGLSIGLGLFWLMKLLYIDSVVSPMGAGLIYVTTTSRLLYAMSHIGFVPKFLSRINSKGFPMLATAVNFVIGMLLFLPLPGWQAMVNFIVSAIVISYAVGPIALLCLRDGLPDEERPFRLPFAKFFCLAAFYCCNLFCYWTGWETISVLGIALSVGLFLIAFATWQGSLKINAQDFRSASWIIFYLIGLIVISYLGSFGGKNIITFGWDFLVVGLFSIAILYMALHVRLDIKENYEKYRSLDTQSSSMISEAAPSESPI